MQLIQDSFFRIEIDPDGTSPCPQRSIWRGQHTCVSENFAIAETAPSPERCGEIIIKHQLAGDRGHYSVLKHGFIKFEIGYFPHNCIMQLVRHQDSNFLVESNRYTGNRFLRVANGELDIEEVFYVRPCGEYVDRKGNRYEVTEAKRRRRLDHYFKSCGLYAEEIGESYAEEDARDSVPGGFRQHCTMSGTFEAFWHWLDQRTKKDSQLEIQTLAAIAFGKAYPLAPQLMGWYKDNRYGKAKLAP